LPEANLSSLTFSLPIKPEPTPREYLSSAALQGRLIVLPENNSLDCNGVQGTSLLGLLGSYKAKSLITSALGFTKNLNYCLFFILFLLMEFEIGK
jgi:hypothetical protein